MPFLHMEEWHSLFDVVVCANGGLFLLLYWPTEFAYLFTEFVITSVNVSHEAAGNEVELACLFVKILFISFYVEYFGNEHVVRTEGNDLLYTAFDAEGRLLDDRTLHAFGFVGSEVHLVELVVILA